MGHCDARSGGLSLGTNLSAARRGGDKEQHQQGHLLAGRREGDEGSEGSVQLNWPALIFLFPVQENSADDSDPGLVALRQQNYK